MKHFVFALLLALVLPNTLAAQTALPVKELPPLPQARLDSVTTVALDHYYSRHSEENSGFLWGIFSFLAGKLVFKLLLSAVVIGLLNPLIRWVKRGARSLWLGITGRREPDDDAFADYAPRLPEGWDDQSGKKV